MNVLERICRERRAAGTPALVPYLTAGFPDEATTLDLLSGCARRGCDVVEVGVPFSDPVADGPVIQRASQLALERGMTLRRALHLVRELKDRHLHPVLMTYLNPILRFGFAAFAAEAAEAGCAGVIVPDLSHGESAPLREALLAEGIALVDLVAPTTPDDRMTRIAGPATGFLYLVSVAGVTGGASGSAHDLAALAARVRARTDVPIYMGFGIDGSERARRAAAVADGVIVGSALVRRLLDEPRPDIAAASALALVDELVAALVGLSRRAAS